MASRSFSVGLLIGSAMFLSAASAAADVVPPDVTACNGKSVGASCTWPDGGVCVNSTCSKLDYTHLDDAGHPTTTSYACVDCQATDAGAAAADGGPSSGGGGCSAAGVRAAGMFAVALVPLAFLGLVKRRRK